MYKKVPNTSLTQAFKDFQNPNQNKIPIIQALNRFIENRVNTDFCFCD